MRNEPVPTLGSPMIGSPRISSQARRSTSNGFISTAVAGNGHSRLWTSIARLIASRFLASEVATSPSLRGPRERLHRVVDRLPQALAQVDLRLPAEQRLRA